MIAPYFLPRRRVGAYRPFKFAIHLKEFGWEPTVVSIDEQNGELTGKEHSLLSGITVHKLSPPFDFTQKSGSQLNKADTQDKPGKGLKKSLLHPIFETIDRNFPVDTWLPFFYLKKSKILEIAKDIQPEIIWATGDPWSGLWTSKELSKHIDIPFIADMRDPWSLCPVRNQKRSKWVQRIDSKIETEILQQAAQVVFTAEATADRYREHYPFLQEKATTIYNSFDRALYDDPIFESAPEDKTGNDVLDIVFFGKFRELSPAKPLIEIMAKVQKTNPELSRSIRIRSFGSLSKDDRILAENLGVEDNFVSSEPVALERALSTLRKSDVLLLSTNPERKDIIPAKLWDYLAAGKPILSVAPNPEIEQILHKTGTGVHLSIHKQQEVADLLLECTKAVKQQKSLPILFDPDREEIVKFESRQITNQLADLLNIFS